MREAQSHTEKSTVIVRLTCVWKLQFYGEVLLMGLQSNLKMTLESSQDNWDSWHGVQTT